MYFAFQFGVASDVFALGVTLYEIAARAVPFSDAANVSMIIEFVRQGEREPMPEGTPAAYWALVERCWDAKAADRPTADDVVDALESLLPSGALALSKTLSDVTAPMYDTSV